MRSSDRSSLQGITDAIVALLVRALMALPASLQVRLSRRAPVRLDGLELAAEVQLMLALLERMGDEELGSLTPEQMRTRRRRQAAIFGGRPEPVGSVRDLVVAGGVPARHYAPARETPAPLLVFFHGGGFVFGDLETHDALCRLLCSRGGMHVLAVDYRLAPEHPFPAAVEDAWAAYAWALEGGAAELGADPARIGVGGDSAGGNLAAVTCQLAAAEGVSQPALQLLIYPAVDFSQRTRSRELFAEGFFLTSADMDWFEEQYLSSRSDLVHDYRASPLLSQAMSGLAPAIVVTAGFDPLRDEGEEYARLLREAGTPVLLRRFPGMVHGFVSAPGVSRGAREAVVEIAGAARAVLETGVGTGVAPAGRPL